MRLADAEERLSSILDSAGEGICGVDLEGRTTFANAAAAELTGWDIDDLTGGWQHDRLHHTAAGGSPYPRDECPVHAVTTDGLVRRMDNEVFWRKDGSSFAVEYTATPISRNGAIVGAVVTFRDVTRRRLAEDALRRSEEHYRQLIENALDIVTVLNPDGTIRYSSPSVESALGYLPEDLVGMDVFDLFHPDDAAGMLQAFQGTIDGQEPQPARVFHRFRFRHKDQSWRSFEAVDSRLVVGSSIEGVLVNSSDVTERERTEAALRESEERYRDLFENASDLIQSVTTDGSLEYVNKAWRDTLGYTSEDVAQLNVRDVVAPGSREDWLAMVRRVTTRQASEELEAEFVTKGGETITVEGDISCRLVDGIRILLRSSGSLRPSVLSFRGAVFLWRSPS